MSGANKEATGEEAICFERDDPGDLVVGVVVELIELVVGLVDT